MRRVLGSISGAALVIACALAFGAASAPAGGGSGQVRAGVGEVDGSWHVGASAGQYAGDSLDDPEEFVSHELETFDPTGHATRRFPSYGMQSRLSIRAIVVEGPDGQRMAIVKNDLYIPQDLVYRRAAQILAGGDSGINAQNLVMAATHNHSSPMYSSTSWGVWAFQDVFDIRFFEYLAQQMAAAVDEAADGLVPARVGADIGQFDKTHRHSFGPAVADDGTPAGYPRGDTDHDLTVVRFDDITNPSDPVPLANLVNFSLHPEFLEGNDLISGDYVAPLQRMLDRETGAMTLYTQGAVGTSEPERSEWHSLHERLEFSHRDYAQAEFGARLMANAAKGTFNEIGGGSPRMPFDDNVDVDFADAWYPGPLSHPYPTVSNCRADTGLAGDPLLPIIGLPDCEGLGLGLDELGEEITGPLQDIGLPVEDPGLSTDSFQALGIPFPENYGAPSYTGLQEDIDVHLQAFRFGDMLFTVCSCEQWFDQSRNIELRTNRTAGDETLPGNLGYDWGAECEPRGDGTYLPDGTGTGTWDCPNPGNTAVNLPPVTDHELKRMRAQVNNDASGWNNIENVLSAESEPVDPRQIKGNFTHDDTPANAALGYGMTTPISMANDYNGYIASYREYQRGDHYRKALTGWGPHSSDYLATRMATLARQMQNPLHIPAIDQVTEGLLQPKVIADLAVNDLRATALGAGGGAAIAAHEALLPDDGGDAEAVEQPADLERFGAAFFTWNGGSNFTDNPEVRVERKVGESWEPYADQSGEIPVTLDFPAATDVPAYLVGDQRWHWTAHFEAFVAGSEDNPLNTGDRGAATPAGTYRFAVEGQRRDGSAVVDYELTSGEFQVKPWSGITVEDFRLEPGGTMSFAVGPRNTYDAGGGVMDEIGPVDYPDSYDSPAPFIRNERRAFRDPAAPNDPDQVEWYCWTCSFRPWIDFGDAAAAVVAVTRADGCLETATVTRQGGRWVTSRALAPGETAQVLAGGVIDGFGNFNGDASPVLSGGGGSPGTCPDDPGPGPGGRGGGGGGSGTPGLTLTAPGTGTATLGGGSGLRAAKVCKKKRTKKKRRKCRKKRRKRAA